MASFSVAVPAAYYVSTGLDSTYRAEGRLWVRATSTVEGEDARQQQTAAMRGQAWIELLRSYVVLDAVVMEEGLVLRPSAGPHRALASFGVAGAYLPGSYELRVDEGGPGFTLVTAGGALVQQGTLGAEIGANIGFEWAPDANALRPGERLAFEVLTPREAAHDLSQRLEVAMATDGSMLRVAFVDPDPRVAADVLHAVMERYVEVATDLKARRLDPILAALEEQLDAIGDRLVEAERELEEFRVAGIRSPDGEELSAADWQAEEGRLRRRVGASESLYDDVRRRVEEARLARWSSTPDVGILTAPAIPNRRHDSGSTFLAMVVFFAGLGAAFAGARLAERRGVFDPSPFDVR